MKKKLKTVLLVSVLVPWTACAQVQWFVTLDEYGNGTAVNGAGTIVLNGQLMPDPSGGIAGNALVYSLPFNFPAASVGDYLLLEPPNYTSVSDVVRFWAPVGQAGNQVIFYSDLPDVDDQPPIPWADTGLPGSYLQLVVPLQESGLEGGYQAVTHSAISGDPGYIGAGLGNYTFISDVPEPASLGLMILGGLLGIRRLFWRKQS
jgi:hypothetical protein